MYMLAHLDPPLPTTDRRASRRRKLRLEAKGVGEGEAPVVIHDISEDGMLLESSAALAPGETIDVMIPETGAARATVMWNSGRYFGCKFDKSLSTAAVSGALLRSPAQPPSEERKRALLEALSELRSLANMIEQITDRVDCAIEQLRTRKR